MLNTERLKNLRKEKNYKQSEMANVLSIGRTTYAKYETGDIQPPIDQVIKIADFFEVSADWLLNRTNDRISPNAEKEELDNDELDIKWGDFRYAFSDGDYDLTDEQKEKMVNLLKFAIKQEAEQNKKARKGDDDKR